jgi:hypothetical protein
MIAACQVVCANLHASVRHTSMWPTRKDQADLPRGQESCKPQKTERPPRSGAAFRSARLDRHPAAFNDGEVVVLPSAATLWFER